MKIRYPPKVEGLFAMNYHLMEIAGDFEPKTKKQNVLIFLSQRGGDCQHLQGGILWGEGCVWGGLMGHTGLGQEFLCPFHQLLADLRRNGSPSPWIPNPVLQKFRFLRGFEFCEIYLTVVEV